MSLSRICMLVHGPYPFGQPPRIAKEIRAAQAGGFLVDVIATRRPGEAARETVAGARVTRLPVAHQRGVGPVALALEYVGFALLAAALLSVRSLRRPYDVVHVNNPPDFLVFCTLIAKVRGSKIVFDVHDLSTDMFAMRFGHGLLASALCATLRVIERAAGRFSHAILTVHEPYRAELVSRRVASPEKIRVVMNGFDDEVLSGVTRVPSRPREAFRVVYHGTVTPHYGLCLLIDAVATLKEKAVDAEVEIYGEGDAVPELIERARALAVGDRVLIYEGFRPHDEVLSQIAGASAGVIANLPIGLNRYALSTKLFEYIALDVPAVVSDLPTLRAHFSSREVMFFKAGDADALAEALAGIAMEPEEARRRAEAARLRLGDYRWSISRDRYVHVLHDLTHKSGERVSVMGDGPEGAGGVDARLDRAPTFTARP